MNTDAAFRAFMTLIEELFDGDAGALARWVRQDLGKAIADSLPSAAVGLAELSFRTALAVRSYGRADRALFESLIERRPGQKQKIAEVAALCGVALGPQPPAASGADGGAGVGAGGVVLSAAQRDQLVELLLACASVSDRQTRDMIVRRLDDIEGHIERHSAPKVDVSAIVDTCAARDGGVEKLVAATRWFEGGTRAMTKLDAYLGKCRAGTATQSP